MNRFLLLLALALALVLPVQATAQPPQYELVIHPLPPNTGYSGINRSLAFGVNDRRQTVVDVNHTINGETRYVTFRYDRDGSYQQIPSLGDPPFGISNDINNHGWTTGASYGLGTFWNGTTLSALEPVNGVGSVGEDINDAGIIAGSSSTDTGAQRATVWNTQNGTSFQIPLFPGDTSNFARGINNAGQVVGTTSSGAFLYENGTLVDLRGSLVSSGTFAINNAGVICGNGRTGGSASKAGLWDLDRTFSFIPGIDPTAFASDARAISDSGLTGGILLLPGARIGSFIHNYLTGETWNPETLIVGGMPPDTFITDIQGMNSFGDIACRIYVGGQSPGATVYGATLYIVPGPGAASLLILSGLVAARRRRR